MNKKLMGLLVTFILGCSFAFSSNATLLLLTPIVFGSVEDSPPDGIGDTIVTFVPGVIDNVQSVPTRIPRITSAIVEYDVSMSSGTMLKFATLDGTIFVNNALDTGERIIEILLFEGDGVLSTTDFQIPAISVGMVSYRPPTDSSLSFSLDVTDPVNSLISGGATFIGARFDALNEQAPSQLISSTPPSLVVSASEPTMIALLGIGFAGMCFARKRIVECGSIRTCLIDPA